MGRRWHVWWQAQGQGRSYLAAGGALVAACLLVFSRFADAVLGHESAGFDAAVTGWVRTWQSPALTAIMRLLTAMGSPAVVTAVALVVLLVLWRRGLQQTALTLAAGVLGASGGMELLKRLFGRPRPPVPWLTDASGFSFPSGHAMVSVAFYGLMVYLVARAIAPGVLRLVFVVVAALGVLGVGISRIYLGVHYPSDVAAGWAAGVAWATACVVSAQLWRRTPAPVPQPQISEAP